MDRGRRRTPYTQAIGKKRRVWWVVGGFTLVSLVFAGGAFVLSSNSREARIDAALESVLDEYGFEFREYATPRGMVGFASPGTPIRSRTHRQDWYYRVPTMSRSEADEVISELSEACEGCQFYQIDHSGGRGTDVHDVFLMREGYPNYVHIILRQDSHGYINGGTTADCTYLEVMRKIKPDSPWQRIMSWLPW